jgi:hypothetical protein
MLIEKQEQKETIWTELSRNRIYENTCCASIEYIMLH